MVRQPRYSLFLELMASQYLDYTWAAPFGSLHLELMLFYYIQDDVKKLQDFLLAKKVVDLALLPHREL